MAIEKQVGEIEAGAHPVTEGFVGNMKEEAEQFSAFPEDAAKGFGDGEDKLAVGDIETHAGGDPIGGLDGSALVAGGAESTGLTGEGEEFFVPAIRALQSSEAPGEVTAAVELLDHGNRLGAEGPVDFAIDFFVGGLKYIPRLVDNLPERRGARTARSINGRHNCSFEQ